MKSSWLRHPLVLSSWLCFIGVVLAQTAPDAITTAKDQCIGVFLTYTVTTPPVKIYPYLKPSEAANQAYRFESEVSVTNTGVEEVTQWELSIGFQYREVIAEASDVLFVSGESPPGLQVGNDTRIIGTSRPDLMTSIDTAENPALISANFTLVGTEFGINETGVPLPANMSMVNVGYNCGPPGYENNVTGGGGNAMWVCCTENTTAINGSLPTTDRQSGYLPRQTGDITMTYDILSAYRGSYKAQVTISLDSPIDRVDYWNLTWNWRQGEFITDMLGAQILGANEQDLCIYGPAAVLYNDGSIDFGNVASCSANPVIVDQTPDRKTDLPPHCCRNGTLYPDLVDPAYSKSVFQLHVYKLNPHTAQNDISPPVNWNIAEGYLCSQPRLVSPSEFDPEALHSSSAVSSWQIVCNKTQEQVKQCCVSFSAYYNDSLIPCPTCSCGGCEQKKFPWNGNACNPYIPPMLLPYNGVLLPPSNRTSLAQQLAKIDHYQVPQPFPCPDNCGVSINWHVYSDYRDGWSARITLFNWDSVAVPKWFSAVEMPVAMPGFQDVYSFNGSKVPGMNNTLFIQGHNGYSNDYLNGVDSKDNPGKVQSVLSFDKRKTPGIHVPLGDGFPSRVWFNGEECQLPQMFPGGSGWRVAPTYQLAVVLLATLFLLAGDVLKFL